MVVVMASQHLQSDGSRLHSQQRSIALDAAAVAVAGVCMLVQLYRFEQIPWHFTKKLMAICASVQSQKKSFAERRRVNSLSLRQLY
jgi:hypothetical protein